MRSQRKRWNRNEARKERWNRNEARKERSATLQLHFCLQKLTTILKVKQ